MEPTKLLTITIVVPTGKDRVYREVHPDAIYADAHGITFNDSEGRRVFTNLRFLIEEE